MSQDAVKKLELRVKELEDQLKTARAHPEPEDISAEELQAYLKVRGQLAIDWGDFCGPNDCMPVTRLCDRCIRWPSETISRCVHVCGCIFECFCGPCNVGGFGSGGIQRFSGLGS